MAWLAVTHLRSDPITARKFAGSVIALIAGFSVGVLSPAIYFLLTDRFSSFLQWTIVFPLFHYPSHTEYFSKAAVKLGALLAIVLATASTIIWPPVRRHFRQWPALTLLAFMGLGGALSLFKTQATHYFFPSLAFLLPLSGAIALFVGDTLRISAKQTTVVAGVALLAAVFSGLAYRPDAVTLFFPNQTSFGSDSVLARYVRQNTTKQGTALFFRNSMYLYWITDRYTNTPYLNFDVQTVYDVSNNRSVLLTAPQDSGLVLVEFDRSYPTIQAVGAQNDPLFLTTLAMFSDSVTKYFTYDSASPAPYHFWIRR